MLCPKCGQQNPPDTPFCSSCGSPLTQPPPTPETVRIRTSRLGIASFVLGILSPLAFLAAALLDNLIIGLISLNLAALAIILGIISLVLIDVRAGKLTGRGLAAIGTAVPGLLLLLLTAISILRRGRDPRTARMVCGTNLVGLGRAMLIYAGDFDEQFPRAGPPNAAWGDTGSETISKSLYLLIRYADVTPKSFICKGDAGVTVLDMDDFAFLFPDGAPPDFDFTMADDFGDDPVLHYSYSYHLPYSPYAIKTSSEAGMAVLADRNPFIDAPAAKAVRIADFDPTGTIDEQKKGNSRSHKREGQNVLFSDNHVEFKKRSYCGIDDDDIYTSWDDEDKRRGAAPTLTSQPADRLDCLLVHDPPVVNGP